MLKDEELYKLLGNNIRTLRETKLMTQQTLADLCNMEKSNLSRIERGQTNITIKKLYHIACGLEITLSDLLALPH
jgi:transcriptional regulator with XRE-family HTH domain